jgi:hypothetical protein
VISRFGPPRGRTSNLQLITSLSIRKCTEVTTALFVFGIPSTTPAFGRLQIRSHSGFRVLFKELLGDVE